MKTRASSTISNSSARLRNARRAPWPSRPLAAGLLFLLGAVACQSPTAPVLQAGESCEGRPQTAIATFADDNLEARVMAALGVAAPQDLTCGRLAQLSELHAGAAGVRSLAGIQNLINLIQLDIGENQIADASLLGSLASLKILFAPAIGMTGVAAIGSLTEMTFLDLSGNSIADVAPLAGLTNLAFLDLAENSISNVGPLSGLTLLRFLYLADNAVTDVGPLGGLSNLATLNLGANAISDVSALEGLTSLGSLDLGSNFTLSDVQPLLDNVGLGTGDVVDLSDTAVACPDITALRAKGITVESGCP